MALSFHLLALVAAALLAPGCGQSPPQPRAEPDREVQQVSTDSLPHRVLLSTQTSGFTDPQERVVRDAATWEALLRAARRHALVEPEPVDFGREMVVLLVLGERGSAGHEIHVDGVAREGDGAVVRYSVASPGPGCIAAQMVTTPAVAVAVPRAAGEVRMERGETARSC